MNETLLHQVLLAKDAAEKLPDLLKRYVLARRRDGATYYDIGDETGYTASYLRKIVHDDKAAEPPKRVLPDRHYRVAW